MRCGTNPHRTRSAEGSTKQRDHSRSDLSKNTRRQSHTKSASKNGGEGSPPSSTWKPRQLICQYLCTPTEKFLRCSLGDGALQSVDGHPKLLELFAFIFDVLVKTKEEVLDVSLEGIKALRHPVRVAVVLILQEHY